MLLNSFISVCGAALCAAIYLGMVRRYDGGGWQDEGQAPLHSKFLSRVVMGAGWGTTVFFGLITTGHGFFYPLTAALVAGFFGFLSDIIVGNSACQVMGCGPMAQNTEKKEHEWPLALLVKLFPSLKEKLSWPWPPVGDDRAYDLDDSGAPRLYSRRGLGICMIGFASIGIVRGLTVALPLALLTVAWSVFLSGAGLWAGIGAALPFMLIPLAMAVTMAFGEALGWIWPINLPGLPRRGPAWGELFGYTGPGAAIIIASALSRLF